METAAADTSEVRVALEAITAEGILQHTRVLSDDSMEGRSPGTPGEDKTIAYLTGQFRELGLVSGHPDGSFVQNVELIGFSTRPEASFTVGNRTIPLSFPNEYVAVSRHEKPEIDVWSSSGTAWSPRNTGGTTTREWT
jgi:hypothetical protein